MTNDDQAPGRIARATIVGGVGRAVNAAVSLAVLALLTRSLGLDELGRFALWGFLLTVLDQLVDFGTGNLVLERGAKDDWAFTSHLRGARALRTRVFALGWVVAAAAVLAVEDHDRAWLLVAFLGPATRRWETSALALQRRVAWERPVAVRSVTALLRLAGVALLLDAGVATAGPLLAWVAVTNSLAHVGVHLAARAFLPRPTIAVATPRDLVAAAWPLALAGLVQLLHVQLDYVFVRALAGAEELARYHVAARVFSYLVWVPVLATQAALPLLARARVAGTLARALERWGLPTGLAGALLLGAAVPHAERILAVAFDEPFRAAGPALRALLVAAAVQWAQAWWVTGLVAAGRGRALFAGSLLALGVNAAANAWLVPRLGGEGAAWATASSELVLGLWAFAVLARHGEARPRTLAAAALGVLPFLAGGALAGLAA